MPTGTQQSKQETAIQEQLQKHAGTPKKQTVFQIWQQQQQQLMTLQQPSVVRLLRLQQQTLMLSLLQQLLHTPQTSSVLTPH
jgi:hypothetical protein